MAAAPLPAPPPDVDAAGVRATESRRVQHGRQQEGRKEQLRGAGEAERKDDAE